MSWRKANHPTKSADKLPGTSSTPGSQPTRGLADPGGRADPQFLVSHTPTRELANEKNPNTFQKEKDKADRKAQKAAQTEGEKRQAAVRDDHPDKVTPKNTKAKK